jgi:hypothetical protein
VFVRLLRSRAAQLANAKTILPRKRLRESDDILVVLLLMALAHLLCRSEAFLSVAELAERRLSNSGRRREVITLPSERNFVIASRTSLPISVQPDKLEQALPTDIADDTS